MHRATHFYFFSRCVCPTCQIRMFFCTFAYCSFLPVKRLWTCTYSCLYNMRVCSHVRRRLCTYAWTQVCTHVCRHVHAMLPYTRPCLHTRLYTCPYECLCPCLCSCLVCVCRCRCACRCLYAPSVSFEVSAALMSERTSYADSTPSAVA